MRTSIISLLAVVAATAVAQSDNYLVTREEFGDALVDLYIREASAGAIPGSDAHYASQVLPVIKRDPVLLARYAEADPNFKSFIHKVGHGLKKVGKFALKGVSKAMSLAGRDEEGLDMDGNFFEAREFDDQLEVREFDDELEARDYEDDELEVREFDEELETRDVDEEAVPVAIRDAEWIDMFNQQFEAREFDEDLYAREFYEEHLW